MRTYRELLIECIDQMNHIDVKHGLEPLASTVSLIKEVSKFIRDEDVKKAKLTYKENLFNTAQKVLNENIDISDNSLSINWSYVSKNNIFE